MVDHGICDTKTGFSEQRHHNDRAEARDTKPNIGCEDSRQSLSVCVRRTRRLSQSGSDGDTRGCLRHNRRSRARVTSPVKTNPSTAFHTPCTSHNRSLPSEKEYVKCEKHLQAAAHVSCHRLTVSALPSVIPSCLPSRRGLDPRSESCQP